MASHRSSSKDLVLFSGTMGTTATYSPDSDDDLPPRFGSPPTNQIVEQAQPLRVLPPVTTRADFLAAQLPEAARPEEAACNIPKIHLNIAKLF